MAPEIAIQHLLDTNEPQVVLDPMCGSGTVLSVASQQGHTAVGFDIDPLAVLMSRVATGVIDPEALAESAKGVVMAAQASRIRKPAWHDAETEKFVSYWFGKPQRLQLARITAAIGQVSELSVRRALEVALSRIIVTKTPKASLAADTSHSRPHRVQLRSDFDVLQGFAESCRELGRLLAKREWSGNVAVRSGDSRALDAVRDCSIDLAITSPPYLNAIDYMRGHRLALVWLGYTISELRSIRSGSIGSETPREIEQGSFAHETLKAVRDSVPYPDRLPSSVIARYAHDMRLFSMEMYRVCRPGAQVVAVVGNSTLRGNFIRNDRTVTTALELAGFHVVDRIERELPENRRYMPVMRESAKSTMAKRMRSEVVLSFERRFSVAERGRLFT